MQAALSPSSLFVPGAGMVFAFGVAAFTGFESGAIYSEEVRNPRVTVARATFIAVGFTGIFYAISAWAMLVTVGSADIQKQAGENGPGVVSRAWPSTGATALRRSPTCCSSPACSPALLSFHHGVARYLFALGRERVLPAALSRVSTRSGGPVAGSLARSVLAVVVVAVFALAGADPVLERFTWLSGGIAALGVILLMAGTSVATVGFFRARPGGGSVWQRAIAPTLATIALVALIALIIGNFDSVIGADPNSPLGWILPGLVLLAAVAGALWALRLKSTRPDVYAAIGTTGGNMDDDESVVLSLPPPTTGRHGPAAVAAPHTPGRGRGGQVSGVSRPRA